MVYGIKIHFRLGKTNFYSVSSKEVRRKNANRLFEIYTKFI